MSTALPDAPIASPQADVDQQTKRQPPYGVVLHNDDVNTFEFVITTIRKVFGYDRQKCFRLTLEAHETGRSLLWSGTLEGAELKRDQVRSCGADPIACGALPLKVTLEEMPQ